MVGRIQPFPVRGLQDHLDAGPGEHGEDGTQPIKGLLGFTAGNTKALLGCPGESKADSGDGGEGDQPGSQNHPRSAVGEATQSVEESSHQPFASAWTIGLMNSSRTARKPSARPSLSSFSMPSIFSLTSA